MQWQIYGIGRHVIQRDVKLLDISTFQRNDAEKSNEEKVEDVSFADSSEDKEHK